MKNLRSRVYQKLSRSRTVSFRRSTRGCLCRALQCRKIVLDQLVTESSRPGESQSDPWENASRERVSDLDIRSPSLAILSRGFAWLRIRKRAENRAQSMGPLLESYLLGRTALIRVVLLVDSRVVTDQDRQTMAWLRSIGHDPLIVVTKVDKLKTNERVRTVRQIHQSLGVADEDAVIPYSSMTGEGRDRLWGSLREAAGRRRDV